MRIYLSRCALYARDLRSHDLLPLQSLTQAESFRYAVFADAVDDARKDWGHWYQTMRVETWRRYKESALQ